MSDAPPHHWPLTTHLHDERLSERRIPEAVIRRAVEFPHRVQRRPDGTVHYIRAFREYGGRYLRVVANPQRRRLVSAFWDRRLGRREYRR